MVSLEIEVTLDQFFSKTPWTKSTFCMRMYSMGWRRISLQSVPQDNWWDYVHLWIQLHMPAWMTAQALCGMETKAPVSHCVWCCFTPELFAVHTEYVCKSIQETTERCAWIATDCSACITARFMGSQVFLPIPVFQRVICLNQSSSTCGSFFFSLKNLWGKANAQHGLHGQTSLNHHFSFFFKPKNIQ